jgi:hypothetical protein
MSANGISTHSPKSERRDLKLALASAKRQGKTVATDGTITGSLDSTKPYYRPYNVYTSPGTVSPAEGHPWTKT